MRLPTDKVWRAFPELDRFSDEQCRGFVRAARRAWGWRLVRVGAMGVALVLAIFGGATALVGTLHLLEEVWHVRREGVAWGGAVAAGMLTMALIMIGGMFVRDWLLRKRIRFAIFNRGVCQKCDYSLVGMPVSDKSTVVCPECGMESEVDPALGELAQDDFGKPVLRAVDESLMPKARKPRVFTAARVKKAAKWAAAAVLVLVIGAVGWYIWDRYETARQAEIAKKERPGAAAIVALQESVLPKVTVADQADGWLMVNAIISKVRGIDARVWQNVPDGSYPEYMFFRSREEEINEDQRERWRASRDTALQMLSELKQADVFTWLDNLAGIQRAAWEPALDDDTPAVNALLPELAMARTLAKINALRMYLAIERGDLPAFRSALESNLAITRFCSTHPTIIGQLVGIAIDALTAGVIREVLRRQPGAEWLDAIEGARTRQTLNVPRGYAAKGERLLVMDTLAWSFSDPARISRSALQRSLGLGPLEGRVGSYSRNRDVMEDLFKAHERALVQHRWEREPFSEDSLLKSDLMFVRILTPALGRTVAAFDNAELERAGLDTMIALERFRLRTGAYPERLDELTPREMKAIPLDPWSGKQLGYRRVEPQQDRLRRGYLLYSVGGDGKDDGGKEYGGLDANKPLVGRGIPGVDFMLNNPER